jgi:hypothetical protein
MTSSEEESPDEETFVLKIQLAILHVGEKSFDREFGVVMIPLLISP